MKKRGSGSLKTIAAALAVILGAAGARAEPGRMPIVLGGYPHDAGASTQGLVLVGDLLLESTGGYGTSTVRLVELASGRVLLSRSLPPELFGEGLALLDGILYQLTWRSGMVLKYDPATLSLLGSARIEGEGWGLASDGRCLVLSDGSAVLRFVHPQSFRELRRIVAHDERGAVAGLNELEFVRGLLAANVYPTAEAVLIEPETGRVVGRLDLRSLWEEVAGEAENRVPNGIAYDPVAGRLLVTGKNWPRIYEIAAPPMAESAAIGRK